MFDRATFLRPIAHRGLHNATTGRIENTAPAFEAAIAGGFAIECDLRPAANGLPVVFHDQTLDRLIEGHGPVAHLAPSQLKALRYRGQDTRIQTFHDFLDQVSGRVPLFVEVKSEWDPPQIEFLAQIARACLDYHGPVALMSFDPDVMVVLRELATEIPRGIVSGSYKDTDGETWWPNKIDEVRAERLAKLQESGPVAPSFYAYHVAALPTPVTCHVREVLHLPVITWTVRTEHDWMIAKAHADAPVFEGPLPG
jgi:glycerophosphoryl diester phosphodiesterase